MKYSTKLIIGILFLGVGGLLLIEKTGLFGWWNIDVWAIIFKFWPLILVLFGIKSLIEKNITGGLILLVIGGILLLTNIFHWNFFAILWPMIIIAVGLSIIFKDEKKKPFKGSSTQEAKDSIHESAVFWGLDKEISSDNFTGGEVDAVFGGAEIDLSEVKVAEEGAVINVNAVFGGVGIIVPKNCKVITNGTGVLGGWEVRVKNREITKPILEINGTAAFGGVEIKE